MKLVDRIETILEGSRLEPLARRLYQQARSIGRPRARQSLRYDRDTARIMARVLQPDSCCVDVGAHRGSLLADMVARAPQGLHLACEPLPHLAARLRRRFPGVEIHQVAVSDVNGEATFCHVVDDPGLSGMRRLPKVKAGARVETITVPTRRLDDLVPADRAVRFVKIDVEGAQLQVFRGAEATLRRCRPIIVFEHGYLAQEAYGASTNVVWDELVERLGLRISRLADWLSGAAPLTRQAFNGSVGLHPGSEFCFVAHP
jgi:FkbM family methyltransferase